MNRAMPTNIDTHDDDYCMASSM